VKQALLGHAFADPSLEARALTHRSAGHNNNERLEFLGDALLNLFVAELVFDEFPKATEGEMTRLRAAFVNGTALAGIAREQDLGDRLNLGPGELKSGGYRRDSILADAFEALLAAIYLDAGWAACRNVVRTLFAERVRSGALAEKDAKTRLQERLQGEAIPLPVYMLEGTSGEDHARIFEVSCEIADLGIRTSGSGTSRRAAEQVAAEKALGQIVERR
jgi:ribonuclease-3